MKTRIVSVIVAALLLGAVIAVVVIGKSDSLRVTIPEYQAPPGELIYSEQGWSAQEAHEFHHTSQGTRLMPYEWFMALEQPCLAPGDCGSFSDPEYLARFGFLASEKDSLLNPDGLPIGFARQTDSVDPSTGTSGAVLGLTCAACHTGALYWDKYAVRIEGGPAMIEVDQFQKALGLALGLTNQFPFSMWRYGRFEAKVLGEGASDEAKTKLKIAVTELIANGKNEQSLTKEVYRPDYAAGFARTDALARIGNQVFAFDMQNPANLDAARAPVRYPQLWDASWLNWVQYNSSIADPLVRNIGESLGVRAALKLYGDDASEFKNSVNLPGLRRLEELLAGKEPFGGLASPKWPEVFPRLDEAKVAKGAALYSNLCERCHGPSIEKLKEDLHSENPRYWETNSLGLRLLKVKDVKLDYIGTDPLQAEDFKNRSADTGSLGKGRVSAEAGLELVTVAIAKRFFDENNIDEQQRLEWSGMRDPNADPVRAPLYYKARPLNGAWAIAPYLHNGSVPNLYLLLSPAAERPETFYTGSRQFDPVHVGYEYGEIQGGYLYETNNPNRPGNSNAGHEFSGDGTKLGNGVIGRGLSEDERWALVEYLKSI